MKSLSQYQNYSGPQYNVMDVQALYIPMRDGVRIAIDVLLPANLPADAKLPTVLMQTRYWRSREYHPEGRWIAWAGDELNRFFVTHGYAVLLVDVRGTGASFGSRRHPWNAEEIKDAGDIVDWIVAQSWSNGKVGGYGISYEGSTAELLAVPNHAAVKAVIPCFNEFDVYTDITFPGGIYLAAFIRQWSDRNIELDDNVVSPEYGAMGLMFKGVKPVDEDQDGNFLRQAINEHQANISIASVTDKITFRDDRDDHAGVSVDDFSVYTFREEIERSQTAVYGWGGWFDAGTADAVIRRFATFNNPQLAIIGAWNHGGGQHASPYAPAPANLAEQWFELLRFFDIHLKGVGNGAMVEKSLAYFTVGEEKWKTTPVWPPIGSVRQRYYLAEGNALSQQRPTAKSGADRYAVDFEATTGLTNRWHTQMGGVPVHYPDRVEEDGRLLTYTSPPLPEDTEITGYPIVTLYVTSTATDGAFFVYLEDVDENGRVTYLVEGQLRAIHRKVSTDVPPYTQFVPYHSFKRQDGMPLVPGEVAELTFGLLPTSALLKKGHRIRIAIAGADKDSFLRIPAEGSPVVTVARNEVHASFIDLPIIK